MDFTHKAINKETGETILVEKRDDQYLVTWAIQIIENDWIITPLPEQPTK